MLTPTPPHLLSSNIGLYISLLVGMKGLLTPSTDDLFKVISGELASTLILHSYHVL